MASNGHQHRRERPTGRFSTQPTTHYSSESSSIAQSLSQSASHSSNHSSASVQGIIPTPAEAGRRTTPKKSASLPVTFLLPIILIAAFFMGTNSLGSSCANMSSDFLDYGSGSGWNTSSGHGIDTAYTVGEGLGQGDKSGTWTVLMYLCGSDLESTASRLGGGQATSNLIELTKANLGDNVTFAIETGGARKWQNDVVSARCLSRYTVKQNALALESREPSASMAESSTFADFLEWGVHAHPADHYMVVIWDHGGGSIAGVCQDELYPTDKRGKSDSLTLAEMREALKTVDMKFDIFGFDTCLMSSLETAEMLTPYADYMVASEESEPGSGWDYAAWPTWLSAHPATSAADLGTVICQSYFNKCMSIGQSAMATLSVVDLSKVSTVSSAFERVSDDIALATVDSSSLRRLRQGARSTESYGSGAFTSFNMVDLGDLMSKTKDVVGADADAVTRALDNAVVFQVKGRSRAQASGLSVFYPLDVSDPSAFHTYADLTTNTPYLQFLGVMYGVYDNYDWTTFDNYVSIHGEPVNQNNYRIDYRQSWTPEGHLRLDISNGADQVASVSWELYAQVAKTGELISLGSDNDMTGSYDEGWFVDNFQDDWIAIDGNILCTTLSEEADNYNLYYAPVLLNGTQTGIILEYDYTTDEFAVLCVYDEGSTATGMAGKTGQLLEEGDTLEFLFPVADDDTGEQRLVAFGSMTWHEDAEIDYADLGDGDFAMRYRITDVLGNVQKTDYAYFSYADGKPSQRS